ncbi:CIS tube protein [Ferruginibacter profundus]
MASPELMKITGYTDENFQTPVSGAVYTVMINPDSLKWQSTIEYSEEQAPDSSAPSQRYKNTPSEKLNFDMVIDCTGIVDATRTRMKTEIDALEKIIYNYNGDIHRPNFVKIQWGADITFKGVLTSYDISYTLFSPDGNPLRAKISLSFSQYDSPSLVSKIDGRNSPDITHLLTVVEGMTLPQMCLQVWNSDAWYIQAAKYNKLNKFRNLDGVRNLIFPPIIQPG